MIDEVLDFWETVFCPACGCPDVSWRAPLGGAIWSCCRDCGLQYSVTPDEQDETEVEVFG